MATTTDVTEKIEKRQYRNNTGGWIGVVTLDHLGQELGVSVPPGQTIWLSKAEAILTARAPQNPADNPFEEREFRSINMETGRPVIQTIRPITLVSREAESMYGDGRYVPGISEEPKPVVGVDDEDEPSEAELMATETASRVTAAAAARSAQIEAEAERDGSWTVPEAPGIVLQGTLGGADEPAQASRPAPPPQRPIVQPAPVRMTEETAAVGEETGSVTNGHAEVAGEYAQAEEVGTSQLGSNNHSEEQNS